MDSFACGEKRCEYRGKTESGCVKRKVHGKVDFFHFLSEDMVNYKVRRKTGETYDEKKNEKKIRKKRG